jgi:hypothetical protein
MTTETEISIESEGETRPRPSYLGMLNAISLAESQAGVYLKAWADVTPDPKLRQALRLVASRETTHGEVFCQRIERLGFTLREREDPDFAERLRVYGSPARSDIEKIEYGRRGRDGGADPLAAVEARADDETVDALTRHTLRWYVAEERDSGELLRSEYARVEAEARRAPDRTQVNGSTATRDDLDEMVKTLSEGFGAMMRAIADLAASLDTRDKAKDREKARPKEKEKAR